MTTFIIQCKHTGTTYPIAANDFSEVTAYIDNYLMGDSSDYTVSVASDDVKRVREVKRQRNQLEKQYAQDIEDYKENLYS